MVGLFMVPSPVNLWSTLVLAIVCLPFVVLALRTEWRLKTMRLIVACLAALVLSSVIAYADDPPNVKLDCEYVWWTLECLIWG
jgi:hypothetical protein